MTRIQTIDLSLQQSSEGFIVRCEHGEFSVIDTVVLVLVLVLVAVVVDKVVYIVGVGVGVNVVPQVGITGDVVVEVAEPPLTGKASVAVVVVSIIQTTIWFKTIIQNGIDPGGSANRTAQTA